jgi:Initiator Replication protein
MDAVIPNDPEVDILSKLFVRSPRAFSPEEARLFALALNSLTRNAQQVTFQLAFNDIIPGGNEDGKQYAKLLVAIKRLMQAIKFQTFQQGTSCSEYLLLFSTLGMNADTGLITGKFNPDLKAHLLDLGDKFTTADLESLLMRRQ